MATEIYSQNNTLQLNNESVCNTCIAMSTEFWRQAGSNCVSENFTESTCTYNNSQSQSLAAMLQHIQQEIKRVEKSTVVIKDYYSMSTKKQSPCNYFLA